MPQPDLWSWLLAPDDIMFASFDLEREGLRAAGEAVEAQDWMAARRELLAYFRNKSDLPFGLPARKEDPEVKESEPSISADGEDALQHKTTIFGQNVQLPDRINWCHIPITLPHRAAYHVNNHVNQHDLMQRLACAYVETGNDKYARHCADLMRDWLHQICPYPRTKYVSDYRADVFYNPAHCRRPRNWSYIFSALRNCDVVSDEERIAMIKFLLREVAWIRDNFQGNPNHCISIYFRLLEFADWWPELHNHKTFISFALNGLFLCMDDFMYADGAYVELCYYDSLGMFLTAAEIARRHDVPLPMDYTEKCIRFFDEFLLMITKPNGLFPHLNDHGNARDEMEPEGRARRASLDLFKRGSAFFDDDGLRWIGSWGDSGLPPRETSKHFPYAGLFVMRSHWSVSNSTADAAAEEDAVPSHDADAMYMILDGGRNLGGEQHAHMDKLSFELYAHGRTLICDTGYGGPWFDRWRSEYYVATPGHNTILVDGCWQAQYPPENLEPDQHWHAPGSPPFKGNSWSPDPCQAWHAIMWRPLDDNTWQSSDCFDFAAAAYDQGYTRDPMSLPEERVPVRHMRSVFFMKPRSPGTDEAGLEDAYFLIWDALDGGGEHTIDSLFHFPPDATIKVDENGSASLTATVETAAVRVCASSISPLKLEIVSGQLEPVIQGWAANGWGEHLPSPCAVVSTISLTPVDIFTVLYPYKPGHATPKLETRPLDFGLHRQPDVMLTDRAAGVEIVRDPRTDLFFFSTHPAMPYTARDSSGNSWSVAARVCCIRLDSNSDVLGIHAIGASVIRRNDVRILASDGLELIDIEYETGQVTVRKRGWGSLTIPANGRSLAVVNGNPMPPTMGGEEFQIS